jgi:peptide/nickel transport system permease protein
MKEKKAVAKSSSPSKAILISGTALHGSPSRHFLRRLQGNRVAMIGLLIITMMALIAVFGPLIAPHDPDAQFRGHRLESPNQIFLLGTDNLGRDLLSRLLHGARLSIGMAALATIVIAIIAVAVGCLAGYVGGLVDDLAMRVADVLLAFPGLVLALAIIGILGPGLVNVIFSVTVVAWAGYARLVRGLVFEVREKPFVEAAQAIGASRTRIVLRHIIPNVISPVIVVVSLELGGLILTIASLNFLGLGVQPPTAEWGAMLNQGRLFFQSEPQLMIYPGVMISLTVLGFNLVGDGLRDVLDPRYIQ